MKVVRGNFAVWSMVVNSTQHERGHEAQAVKLGPANASVKDI